MGVIKHGMSGTPFYARWYAMRGRCNNTNHPKSHLYTGRGIHYDEARDSFDIFKEDMYESFISHAEKHGESDTTLDRIDNDKGYSKSNCRRATNKVQSNNRITNRYIEYNGIKKTIKEWSETTGINKDTILMRVNMGRSSKDVITKKVSTKNVKHDCMGKSLTLKEWSKELGIKYETLHNKLSRGITIGELININKDNI